MRIVKKEFRTSWGIYDYTEKVIVTMAKKVWAIHVDDHDFHVSRTYGEYASREKAERVMHEDEAYAYRMGDAKFHYVVQEEIYITKTYVIDSLKRAKRAVARRTPDFCEKMLLGVLISWDGTILETKKGTFYDLDYYGMDVWGGDTFIFRDADGEIHRYKSVRKALEDLVD